MSTGTFQTFELFYQAEYRSVLGLAYVLSGEQGAAEDLTQDAFTETHRQWEKVSQLDNPAAWVRRVLVNKSGSRFRKLFNETKALARLDRQQQVVINLQPESEETWKAVRSLPKRQAQAIALRYLSDLTISQIAGVMECSQETVKTHLKRAKATLTTKLIALPEGEQHD